MEYRKLGRSGLKVSPLCLGTMMFGGPTDEPTSARIIARAKDAGINFIDTADVYNEGRSEEVVGRALRAGARPLGAGDQDVQPDGAGAEPARAVAPLDAPGLRRLAGTARHRLDRHPVPPQGGPRHAARGDRRARSRT